MFLCSRHWTRHWDEKNDVHLYMHSSRNQKLEMALVQAVQLQWTEHYKRNFSQSKKYPGKRNGVQVEASVFRRMENTWNQWMTG